jgi:hypothetical protein
MISIEIPKISQYKKILHQHKQLSFIIYQQEHKQLLPNIFQYKKNPTLSTQAIILIIYQYQRKQLFLII